MPDEASVPGKTIEALPHGEPQTERWKIITESRTVSESSETNITTTILSRTVFIRITL